MAAGMTPGPAVQRAIAESGVTAVGRDAADPVNPSHYASHTVQPTDLIRDYDLNFGCGNVIKYVARHKEKNGREDLKKALWYLLWELNVPQDEIRRFTKSI